MPLIALLYSLVGGEFALRAAVGAVVPLSTIVDVEIPEPGIDRNETIDAAWNARLELEAVWSLDSAWRVVGGTGLEPEVRLARSLEGAGFQIVPVYLGGERVIARVGTSHALAWMRGGWGMPIATDPAMRRANLGGGWLAAIGIALEQSSWRLSFGWMTMASRVSSDGGYGVQTSDWEQNRLIASIGVAWP